MHSLYFLHSRTCINMFYIVLILFEVTTTADTKLYHGGNFFRRKFYSRAGAEIKCSDDQEEPQGSFIVASGTQTKRLSHGHVINIAKRDLDFDSCLLENTRKGDGGTKIKTYSFKFDEKELIHNNITQDEVTFCEPEPQIQIDLLSGGWAHTSVDRSGDFGEMLSSNFVSTKGDDLLPYGETIEGKLVAKCTRRDTLSNPEYDTSTEIVYYMSLLFPPPPGSAKGKDDKQGFDRVMENLRQKPSIPKIIILIASIICLLGLILFSVCCATVFGRRLVIRMFYYVNNTLTRKIEEIEKEIDGDPDQNPCKCSCHKLPNRTRLLKIKEQDLCRCADEKTTF